MTGRRARRKPGENRERLIEAGLIEFGLFGFHGASTAAIAARADVPQPHVYANFSNKQDLFLETCAAAARIVLEHGDAPSETAPPRNHERAETDDPLTGAQSTVLQAISALATPDLTDGLLAILLPFRAAIGAARFVSVYGAVGDAMIGRASTLQ